MKNTKMKYLKSKFFYALLLIVFSGTLNVFADDGDPFAPPENDPGNVPINDFLLLLFIVGVMYAFYRLASTKREFTSN